MNKSDKLKILTTTWMIHDLVQEIGGDKVDCLGLISSSYDPHSYELVKGDIDKCKRAQIIFCNGLHLECSANLIHFLTSHPNVVYVAEEIQKKTKEQMIYINGQIDPHVWMDISLWEKAVDPICEYLIKMDPEAKKTYRDNAKKTSLKLLELHKKIQSRMNIVPPDKRFLVTSHDAFRYFVRAYLAKEEEKKTDLWLKRLSSPAGLMSQIQLNSYDIVQVVDYLEKHSIHSLFLEPFVNPSSIKKIVSIGEKRGLDLKVSEKMLYGDSLDEKDMDYVDMMLSNCEAIVGALRK